MSNLFPRVFYCFNKKKSGEKIMPLITQQLTMKEALNGITIRPELGLENNREHSLWVFSQRMSIKFNKCYSTLVITQLTLIFAHR